MLQLHVNLSGIVASQYINEKQGVLNTYYCNNPEDKHKLYKLFIRFGCDMANMTVVDMRIRFVSNQLIRCGMVPKRYEYVIHKPYWTQELLIKALYEIQYKNQPELPKKISKWH